MAEWVYENIDISESCSDGAEMSPILLELLNARGICGKEDIEDFLSDRPRRTYDPFLLPDLRETAELVIEASGDGRKICVYGDYDVDGIASTALMLTVIKRLGGNVVYHIPSRFEEGYGLSRDSIDTLHGDEVEFILTVDCGSTSAEEVEYAKSLGMEIAITDHHRIDSGGYPPCLFVNPAREESTYPFRKLCGCGVAFKLAQGIERVLAERERSEFSKEDLNSLLDLVAIATVADVVPLIDENRTMLKYGLEILNARTRPGLRALLERMNKSEAHIGAEDIAFGIAPHLNALGRMDSAKAGVELLLDLGTAYEEYETIAASTVEQNNYRRREQAAGLEYCMKIAEKEDAAGELFPLIFAPEVHEGVAGIIAGNLKDFFNKPVAVLTVDGDGMLKGTGRSIPSVDMHKVLSAAEELFIKFGGHRAACGFTLDPSNLKVLKGIVDEEMRALYSADPEIFKRKLSIFRALRPEEVSMDTALLIKRLEPFGEGNPRPLFSIEGIKATDVQRVGAEKRHIKFFAEFRNESISCIMFNCEEEYEELLLGGELLDIAGELEINEFRGNCSLQFVVRDIRRCAPQC